MKKESNVCVTFRTWESFSVAISTAMRFFRNASRSTSNTNFLSILSQTISLSFSVLRGRAQKDVFEAGMFEKKIVLKDDLQSF